MSSVILRNGQITNALFFIVTIYFRFIFFNTNPIVMKVEIVKALRIIMHIPAMYHSSVKFSFPSAISERARKRKIKANTERIPNRRVMVVDNLNFFIIIKY